MEKEDLPKLTKGSRYRVLSMMTRDEPLTSEGVFKGYTVVGSMDALCIEVQAPKGGSGTKGAGGSKKGSGSDQKTMLRLVPAQMVICVEILEQKAETKGKEPPSDSRYYL